MALERRAFIASTTHAASGAALAAVLPGALWRRGERERFLGLMAPESALGGAHGVAPGATTLRDPQIKALALSAVDAARQAGASYADARLTYTRKRHASNQSTEWGVTYSESEELGLSVRALVDGYWGWAATPYVAAAEAARVARVAVGLAKGCAASRQPRQVEWEPIPAVADGTWMTPIRQDPFMVAIPQLMDWVQGTMKHIIDAGDLRRNRGETSDFIHGSMDLSRGPWNISLKLQQQERVFASTEGSYCTQTVVVTDPHIGFRYNDIPYVLPIRPAQAGYEYVTDTPWEALIQQGIDRCDEMIAHRLPLKALDVGRYDVVFSAEAMASFVAHTWGMTTQVDRALGYEANAGGTSYLGPDPLAFLGTPVASPLVTVTADRTAPKSLATAKWDEEGVSTESFPLVQAGILQDYQTTREQAAWLKPYYQQQHRPLRSHGCAAGTDALTQPMQHTPNLTLAPGKEALGLEELVASLDNGLVVEDLHIMMDFQGITGLAPLGGVTEVRHGKRVSQARGNYLGMLFRSSELWKNVVAVGGTQSLETLYPMTSTKGEPEQQAEYSVSAVPAVIKQMAIIDYTRSI